MLSAVRPRAASSSEIDVGGLLLATPINLMFPCRRVQPLAALVRVSMVRRLSVIRLMQLLQIVKRSCVVFEQIAHLIFWLVSRVRVT
jgi:hypothetical protein